MQTATADDESAAAEAAINEVLDAQSRARAAIDAARVEATARAERAREQARRIGERAGDRLQRALARHELGLRAAVAQIDAESIAGPAVTIDETGLKDVVHAVAAELSGGFP